MRRDQEAAVGQGLVGTLDIAAELEVALLHHQIMAEGEVKAATRCDRYARAARRRPRISDTEAS